MGCWLDTTSTIRVVCMASDEHSKRTSYENESYHLTYCEGCGTISSGSQPLVDQIDEPAIRVGILETVNDVAAYDNVAETVATEEDECRCGGIIVKRYYTCGEYPEPEYEPDEDEFSGRDPNEDALFQFPDGRKKEVRHMDGLEPEHLPDSEETHER